MNCILNGEITDVSTANIPINDLAVLRGYGIFDFFRLSAGVPLFLEEHLDRFYKSAEVARLPLSISRDDLKSRLLELFQLNKMPVSGVRLVLTGGTGAGPYSIGDPNLIITQEPIQFPDEHMYTHGVKLISHEYLRDIPEVKTINYMTGIWLKQRIMEQEAFDVLYTHEGMVHELTRSNIFIVNSRKQVVTPNKNVLLGITRNHLIHALSNEFEVYEREVTLEELRHASEVFITGTTKRVLPVTQVDDRVYTSTRLDGVTHRARQLFDEIESRYAQAALID